jgi:hypothetical protein
MQLKMKKNNMRYLLLLMLFIGCNPVKQVLRDQEKLEEVAKVVVKGGWCANDTTFITKSDTLVEMDTIIRIDTQTDTQIFNDTTYITKWKTRDITKTLTIHDTIKSFIVDNARVRLLQADSARLTFELNEWEGKAKKRQLWIFLLIGMMGAYFYIKSKL